MLHSAHTVLLNQAIEAAISGLYAYKLAVYEERAIRERSDDNFYNNGESKYYGRLQGSIREDIRDLEEAYE